MRKYKFLAAACVWLLLLGWNVSSSSEQIPYQIHFDSKRDDLHEVKEEILQVYDSLIRGVNEESDVMMIVHHLDRFMLDETMEVRWKQNMLSITVGDGKGAVIEGKLERRLLCLPAPKPRSFLSELFQKE